MIPLSKDDRKILKEIQKCFPLSISPYSEIAKNLSISEKELLEKLNFYLELGYIRRVGAILNHIKAGIKANAMVVWEVDEKEVDKIGNIMASFKEVTHCYLRESNNKWPFNLYTMIHAKTKEECEEVVDKIAKATGLSKRKLIFSKKELKKSPPVLFK